MLTVLFQWCYIFLTTFLMGYGFSYIIEKKLHYKIEKMSSLVTVGLVMATVYAQIYSIFSGVGAAANAGLIFICLLILCFLRRELAQDGKRYAKKLGGAKGVMILLLVLFWSYVTSRGIIHYDTDLYHAQSIRWIEEYGVVPGLGNLHVRLAYNSSVFALSALYSMRFLLGQSLHTISGFFALLLSVSALSLMESWKEKRFRLSDYARIAAVYYLTTICDEVVSPASDYVIMCTVFYLVIEWLALLEKTGEEKDEKKENIVPYALLCVVGVFAVSLKLTAGLILLLVIKPAYVLIKEKRWREIACYITMGLVVIAPWLIRTVLLSGYLLYPFPSLDIFSPDWKIPASAARLDAAEIKTWGRALFDASKVGLSVKAWFANWFQTTLTGTEKLLILADIVSLFLLLILAVYQLVIKKRYRQLDYFLVMAAVAGSYLFWQTSAPLVRYGYAYVLLLPALTAGWLICRLAKAGKAIYGLVILAGVMKLAPLLSYAVSVGGQPYYLHQKDYGRYETVSYQIGEEIFYAPKEGDRVGYEAFPSSPARADIELRGEGIAEGFRKAKE